ncbi:MAG: flippase, partial [Minisyncoccia bacterium]
NILSKLFKLIIILFSARILGPSVYGSFSYALSFLGIFFIFSDFGVGNILVRDYQQKEDKKNLIDSAFSLKIFLIIFVSILSILGFLFLKDLEAKKVYFILLLVLIFDNLKNFFFSILSAIQRMERQAFVDFFANLIILILGVVLLLNIRSINSLGFAYLSGAILGFFLSKYFVDYFRIKINFDVNPEKIKYFIVNGIPLMLFGILSFIFFSTDQLLLGYFRTMEEVGYYSIVTKLILNINLFPSLFLVALFPYLASKVNDRFKVREITKKILLILTLSAFFISLFLYLLAPYIVQLILGPKYYQSISILRYLIWIIIFLFPTMLFDNILFAFNKQWQDFGITLFAAILNLILNIFLIPVYGVYGAIIGSLIAQITNLILSSILVHKTICG